MSDKHESSNGGFGFALGLVVGVMAGAAAAILLAPQPGSETREMIATRARDVRHQADRLRRRGDNRSQPQEEGGLDSEGVTIL